MCGRVAVIFGTMLVLPTSTRAQDDPPPMVAAERRLKQLDLADDRPDAMHSLWRLGVDAIPALARGLKDPRFEVVQAVCAVLHEMGPVGKDARAHLEKLIPGADARTAEALRWALHGVASNTFAVALWDEGKIAFLNDKGAKVREHGGFSHPWDVQALPGGHFLVTEANASGVREFDGNGDECWKADVEFGQPLRSQRLFTGNTLIADARSRLVEIDPAGKVVWQKTKISPTWAYRLLNGHTLYVDQATNQLVELDRNGEQVSAYDIPDEVYGAQRLPNGHTLLSCRVGEGSLLELGRAGEKLSRTPTIRGPNHCLRLPNVTVIAGSVSVAAFDVTGAKLWQLDSQWVGGVSR